jgi:iron complex outermembrane receptor protein
VKGASDGLEISPSWQPVSAWRLKGAYSYVRLDLRNEPGNADISAVVKYEGSTPRHRVVIQSLLKLPGGLEFDQTYRYAGAMPAQGVGAYYTADARLGWQFADNFELSVDGRNLAQPHHAEFGRTPGPLVGIKRSVYGTVTWAK